MQTPIVSPKVLRVVSLFTPEGKPCAFVEIAAALMPDEAEIIVDLFISLDAETVTAAIERAKAKPPLLVMAASSDGVNPMTGRPWYIGQIGPASEITLRTLVGMLPVPEDGESCILAPAILAIRPSAGASSYFQSYHDSACLDLSVGDEGGTLHIVVPMVGYRAEAFIRDAKIFGKPLIVWYGPPMMAHDVTGLPVHVGHLTRMGDRHHA